MSGRDDYPYPEDEFDTLGQERVPLGVHRAPLARWRRLLPFLIVLVLAPALAFLAVRVLTGEDPGAGPTQPTMATSSEEATSPSGEPSSEESEEPTSEEPTSEEPSADVDRATQIWVLNGSGVGGLAADTVSVLTADGWEDSNPADYTRPEPTGTTLFYDNPDQLDEAQAVGELLGISNLVENSSAAEGDLVIVLRSDFPLP